MDGLEILLRQASARDLVHQREGLFEIEIEAMAP
jgi:hypothetical protein